MPSSLIETDQNTEGLSNADWAPAAMGTTLTELGDLSARERDESYAVHRVAFERVVMVKGIDARVRRSAWLKQTLESLPKLLNLPPNWDGYGALPIDSRCAEFALSILIQIMGDTTPPPSVVPTVSGGVQLEWHMKGIDLEVEVSSPTQGSYYVFDHRTGCEQEGSVAEGLKVLKHEVLSKLAG
jgi:hypothetical protein